MRYSCNSIVVKEENVITDCDQWNHVPLLTRKRHTTSSFFLYSLFIAPPHNRVINRAPGLKLVVQTLLSSLRPIGNIVLICCTFFIIFGILGVQVCGEWERKSKKKRRRFLRSTSAPAAACLPVPLLFSFPLHVHHLLSLSLSPSYFPLSGIMTFSFSPHFSDALLQGPVLPPLFFPPLPPFVMRRE